MDQLVLQQGMQNEDDPYLSWLNVAIALAFILVDGTS